MRKALPLPSPLLKVALLWDALRVPWGLFGLPFGYTAMVLAARGWPTFHQFVWITLAFLGARTWGIAVNRVVDRHYDALDPAKASRAVPSGRLKVWEVWAVAILCLALFFLASAQLNPLALALTPLAAVYLFFYSFSKRVTWATNIMMAGTTAMAAAGGWIGVTGTLGWQPVFLFVATAAWVLGFDTIWATPDVEFEHHHGLHSIPSQWGVAAALRWAAAGYILSAILYAALPILFGLHWVYYIGWALASLSLWYQLHVVRPHDLSGINQVFFTYNSLYSAIIMVSVLLALYLKGAG